MAKRTERLAGGPVSGTKGFHVPMTRTFPADYPQLGGKVRERERERERALLGTIHNGGSRAAPAACTERERESLIRNYGP